MSDETTRPGAVPPAPEPQPAAAEDQTAAAAAPTTPAAADPPVATAAPAVGAAPARTGSWHRIRQSRVPLLVAGAMLLAGCVLGAGGAAVGALVVDHHGDRMHTDRYDRWDEPRRGGPGWGGERGPGFGGPNGRHGRPGIDRPPVPNVPGAPVPSAAVPAPTAS